MTTRQPSIGIVGAGKVGSALARLLYQQGYTVAGVASRTPDHASALAAQVAAQPFLTAREVTRVADLTIIAVPDDAIEGVAAGLAADAQPRKGVVHTSGVHDASILAALSDRGAQVGSLHPAYPFAEGGIPSLAGVAFAVEASGEPLHGWLADIVAALGGLVLSIPAGKKALYHAALSLSSNYTVTLYAVAEALLVAVGAERETADAALNALLAGTVENLRTQSVPMALTGPLVRRDVGTIETHVAALRQADPEVAALYLHLARLTLPLLARRDIDITDLEQSLQHNLRETSDLTNE